MDFPLFNKVSDLTSAEEEDVLRLFIANKIIASMEQEPVFIEEDFSLENFSDEE